MHHRRDVLFFHLRNSKMLISREYMTAEMFISLKEQENDDFTKLLRLEVWNTTNHVDVTIDG